MEKKDNEREWCDYLWSEEKEWAYLHFNLFGYYALNFDEKPGLDQLFEMVENKRYGPGEVFENPDSVEIWKPFGGIKEFIEPCKNEYTALFDPYFSEYVKSELAFKDQGKFSEKIDKLAFCLFYLIFCYTKLHPRIVSVEDWLILNHNAHCIYDKVITLLFGAGIVSRHYEQTRAANMLKKESSEMMRKKVKFLYNENVKRSPRFETFLEDQQAKKIKKDLLKKGIEYSTRSIKRKFNETSNE